MTDFLLYAKAIAVSGAAIFGVAWCVCGIAVAIKMVLSIVLYLLLVAANISLIITGLFKFFDWKNRRNEEPDPS